MSQRSRAIVLGLGVLGVLLTPTLSVAQNSESTSSAESLPDTTSQAPVDAALVRAVEASAASPTIAPDRDSELRDWHLGLEIATAGSLVLTASLGVIAALNQATAFGEGACARGEAILGQEYGCTHLSTLHGVAGVVTTTLYTATFVLDVAVPDPPRSDVRVARDVLNIVALTGMIATPALGITSRYPGMLGVDLESQADFSETMRTIHLTVAVTTAAAYLAMLILDLAER